MHQRQAVNVNLLHNLLGYQALEVNVNVFHVLPVLAHVRFTERVLRCPCVSRTYSSAKPTARASTIPALGIETLDVFSARSLPHFPSRCPEKASQRGPASASDGKQSAPVQSGGSPPPIAHCPLYPSIHICPSDFLTNPIHFSTLPLCECR